MPGGYGTAGTYDGWAWTLNYGYAAPPDNDIIYGPDPGPPLALMDETTDCRGPGCGNSIPGMTGTPLSFPVAWKNGPGGTGVNFTPETQDPKVNDPVVILVNDPTLHPGSNQPSWTVNLARDVVGNTGSPPPRKFPS